MGSGHRHDAKLPPTSPRVKVILGLALLPFVAATAIGLRVLWPTGPTPTSATTAPGFNEQLVDATVVEVATTPCGDGQSDGQTCSAVTVQLEAGPESGHRIQLGDKASTPGATPVRVGDDVVVSRLSGADGQVTYNFSDQQRRRPLWALAVLAAFVVVAIGRWRGIAAILGLGLTYAVLVFFVLPAVLAGSNPVAVALVGSSLIMLLVLYLAHGVNARTTTALLGTLISMGVTGILSWLFVNATRLSGFGSDEAMYLTGPGGPSINLAGLLLGGIIIGSLGVLNDATVTQASAVWELHAANPFRPAGALHRSGMRIGRDHIASTVYTLVLAYAGASLPLLLLFTMANTGIGDVLNGEIVAEEIVRTLIGSIGLVLSVPITTLIAALVVTRQQPPPSHDGHQHVVATSDPIPRDDTEAVYVTRRYGDADPIGEPVPSAARYADIRERAADVTARYTAHYDARRSQRRAERQAAQEIERRRPRTSSFDPFDD